MLYINILILNYFQFTSSNGIYLERIKWFNKTRYLRLLSSPFSGILVYLMFLQVIYTWILPYLSKITFLPVETQPWSKSSLENRYQKLQNTSWLFWLFAIVYIFSYFGIHFFPLKNYYWFEILQLKIPQLLTLQRFNIYLLNINTPL